MKVLKKIVASAIVAAVTGLSTHTYAQNYSMQFNGTSQYVDLGDVVGDGVRTIEMWFNPGTNINSTTITDYISLLVRDDNTQTSEFGLCFSKDAGHKGQLQFFFRKSSVPATVYNVYSTVSSWSAGTWYHVAGTIDGTGMHLYVNGSLVNTNGSNTSATDAAVESTSIGRWGDENLRYFNGRIENVRLWSTALSATEISNYRCNTIGFSGGTTTGLLAEYLFNEETGSTAINETGANNGTYISTPTWVVDCPCQIAMDFDGVNDWVDLGADVGDNVRSIEMRFRPTLTINNTLANVQTLIARNDAWENEEFGIYFSPTTWGSPGQLAFFARNGGSLPTTLFSGINTWNAGQWYHVTGTIDNINGMSLYIDGTLVDSDPAYLSATTATDAILGLGCWGDDGSRFFDGTVENLRLWSRTLSATEATYHMCHEPSNYANIIAEYRFNEQHGPFVYDQAAGTHNNGSVHGPIWIEYALNNCGAHLEKTTGIEEANITSSELKIYPNPSSGAFYIDVSQFETDRIKSVEIFDALGKLVFSKTISTVDDTILNAELNIKGIYMVKATADSKIYTGKIVIQ